MGRNLIPYLLQHGDSVTALSRSDKADGMIRDAAASAGGKVTIVRGSLESDQDELVKGMHCRFAAQVNVPESMNSLHNVSTRTDCRPHWLLICCAGMTGCDAVIHSAAKVDGWGPWEPFQKTNVEGVQRQVPTSGC